ANLQKSIKKRGDGLVGKKKSCNFAAVLRPERYAAGYMKSRRLVCTDVNTSRNHKYIVTQDELLRNRFHFNSRFV
ncbi:MAG: hypothetical protein K2H47_05115, partial [Muribaculaceae bacterium]|nr:hypothetical protein [Muribaculaceae bacterium]